MKCAMVLTKPNLAIFERQSKTRYAADMTRFLPPIVVVPVYLNKPLIFRMAVIVFEHILFDHSCTLNASYCWSRRTCSNDFPIIIPCKIAHSVDVEKEKPYVKHSRESGFVHNISFYAFHEVHHYFTSSLVYDLWPHENMLKTQARLMISR